MDLRVAVFGPRPVGLRFLWSLIRGLPRESAIVRASARDWAEWDVKAELLATLIEVVDIGNRAFVMAYSKKGSARPEAVKINRPKPLVDRPVRQPTPIHELAQFFGAAVNPGRRPELLGPNGEPIA